MMPPLTQQLIGTARSLVKRLPVALQKPARYVWKMMLNSRALPAAARYKLQIAAEQAIYRNQVEVHDLPPIFHYWSNKYLRPKLESLGFSNPDEFFLLYATKTLRERPPNGTAIILSIGSGNCDTETRLAVALREAGFSDFVIECTDINSTMLERGRAYAETHGVSEHLRYTVLDFNRVRIKRPYDVVIANQSLHHVCALEHLFSEISSALQPHARFLISDMIGRNGHMRWPESERIVKSLWEELPTAKKYNHQLRRLETAFINRDASGSGFEGIRAQDVLPCLKEAFRFELFVGFGNVVDIFIDRAFGPNFSTTSTSDMALIDRIHRIDECELSARRLTPTHAIIAARSQNYTGQTITWDGLTPEEAIRSPTM